MDRGRKKTLKKNDCKTKNKMSFNYHHNFLFFLHEEIQFLKLIQIKKLQHPVTAFNKNKLICVNKLLRYGCWRWWCRFMSTKCKGQTATKAKLIHRRICADANSTSSCTKI